MNEYIYLLLLILLTTSSIGFGYIAQPGIESMINKIQKNYGDTPEECTNLSLRETSHCLRDYVEKIYKYKVTQDIRKLTLEELKEEGGDCKNWAELYYDYGKELGFNVERPVVLMSGNRGHTFTIISDETGYCILDQTSVHCAKINSDYKEDEE